MSNFNTITGIDMKVFFGFRRLHLETLPASPTAEQIKNLADTFSWFDAGTAIELRYVNQKPAESKYSLSSPNAIGLTRGASITQGDLIFKNFNQSSLQFLINEIIANLTHEAKNKPVVGNPPAAFGETNFGANNDEDFTDQTEAQLLNKFWTDTNAAGDTKIDDWSQVPLFDIMVVAKSNSYDANGELSQMLIKDVKIFSTGGAESHDSTELNDIVKFISVSGVEPWSVFKKS